MFVTWKKIEVQHVGGGNYCVVPVSQDGVELECLMEPSGAVLMDRSSARSLAQKYSECGFPDAVPIEEV